MSSVVPFARSVAVQAKTKASHGAFIVTKTSLSVVHRSGLFALSIIDLYASFMTSVFFTISGLVTGTVLAIVIRIRQIIHTYTPKPILSVIIKAENLAQSAGTGVSNMLKKRVKAVQGLVASGQSALYTRVQPYRDTVIDYSKPYTNSIHERFDPLFTQLPILDKLVAEKNPLAAEYPPLSVSSAAAVEKQHQQALRNRK